MLSFFYIILIEQCPITDFIMIIIINNKRKIEIMIFLQ